MHDADVKSARRTLEILELLTRVERPLSFTDIAELLGYPRSSLHGLLRTLEQRGWIEAGAPDRREFTLGIRAWEAGQSYRRALSLAERGRPIMRRIRDELNETVQMAVLEGRWNVYIAKVEGSQRLALQSEVGRRLEAHATGLGKALLSGLSDAELDERFDGVELERFTPATLTAAEALRQELDRVRRRGIAIDREEHTPGVRCIAAPVRDHRGGVVAAISVSIPTVRWNAATKARAEGLVAGAAGELSAALGYRPARPDSADRHRSAE